MKLNLEKILANEKSLSTCRAGKCIVNAIKCGFDLENQEVLVALAKKYFKTEVYRNPSYIKYSVKRFIKFLKKYYTPGVL